MLFFLLLSGTKDPVRTTVITMYSANPKGSAGGDKQEKQPEPTASNER